MQVIIFNLTIIISVNACALTESSDFKLEEAIDRTDHINTYMARWGWDFLSTTGNISAEQIRQSYGITTSIRSQNHIRDFVKLLELNKFTEFHKKEGYRTYPDSDVFLVIDFLESEDSISITFVSDGCYLYNTENMTRRKIDGKFRKKFYYGSFEQLFEEGEIDSNRNLSRKINCELESVEQR